MVDVKTVVVFVVTVFSVFLQPGIRAQPTIGSSANDDFCSQLEDEGEFEAVENARLRSLLESERQTLKTQENVSYSQAEEIQRLNEKLESKQQKIDKLENVSSDQIVENQRLNLALDKKQHKIETLENVSSSRVEENHQLNMELEKKQQKIETLENVSSSRAEENHQLNMELEKKQQKIETLENVSSSQAQENQQLKMELENKQQKIDTLENVSYSQAEEIRRLNLYLENKQQEIDTQGNVSNSKAEEIRILNLELSERRRLRARQLLSVTATFISRVGHTYYHYGITTVEDKIYVLHCCYNKIEVHEDLIGFPLTTDVVLNVTGSSWPYDLVYSNESKCVYISDIHQKCIWVMTTGGEHRLTKWLGNVTFPYTLSLSNEGHLLVLRQSYSTSPDSVEIYSLNATLIRRLQLPQDINDPQQVVQTSDGKFIISHRLNWGPWVISQLTNDGQLINRIILRNHSKELTHTYRLSLDSENNQLFMTDFYNHRVILFDASYLTWSQVLLSKDMNGIREPWRLFYDASKKRLFVALHTIKLNVYEIN